MAPAGKPIEKANFRVLKLKDGRVLVESPLRIKKNGVEPTEMLVLTKDGAEVKERKAVYPADSDIANTYEAYAVIGIIEFCFAKYLLICTQRTLASTLQSHKIWRVTSALSIPIGCNPDTQLTKKARESKDTHTLAKLTLDADLLKHVEEIICSGHMYYSTTYDITHSLQHNSILKLGNPGKVPIDDRYFFNKHVASPLAALGEVAWPWVYKMICGFAGAIDINMDEAFANTAESKITMEDLDKSDTPREKSYDKTYTIALLSRLSHKRLGTRYVRRGLDWAGNAANSVEMEQLVFHHDYHRHPRVSGFVQLRGSAPAVWGQEMNLDYRPELLIADLNKPEVWETVKKHYEDLENMYTPHSLASLLAHFPKLKAGSDGKIVCVNLLDDKGFEGPLTKTYETTVKRFGSEQITYEEFPINRWCKKMNFRNMDILLDRVRDRLLNSGFFLATGSVPATYKAQLEGLEMHRLQTGLARVSCLDSLDRTNLTCSIFARTMLPFQLYELLQPSDASLPSLPLSTDSLQKSLTDPTHPAELASSIAVALQPSLRTLTNLWADSGDAISLLYAGTRALKSDVTRTGKRQWLKGSMDDGLNSLTRYYLNHFVDGRRQDGFDLFTGKISKEGLEDLVSTEGVRKAKRVENAVLVKGEGVVGRVVPGVVVERLEGLVQAAMEFAERRKNPIPRSEGKEEVEVVPDTYIGFLVSAMKLYAPEKITNVLEFLVAMCIFFYVLVLVKVFQLKGQGVVNRPKLSWEYKEIHEIVD
ncbi:hypothetical protein HDV05_002823 [Chytridiales sp. JEL 0842]|nr:hypothetical protein HDV05_002823 [Chytridiales sp. JEL 0842]